jgi:hypothetical protein
MASNESIGNGDFCHLPKQKPLDLEHWGLVGFDYVGEFSKRPKGD